MRNTSVLRTTAALAMFLLPSLSQAQGTLHDYRRAMTLRDRYRDLAVDVADPPTWIRDAHRFWYRKTVTGGHEFILVDATTKTRGPAFDHTRLADALTSVLNRKIVPLDLPFNRFTLSDDLKSIELQIGERSPAGALVVPPQAPTWICSLSDYTCRRQELQRDGREGRGGRGGGGLAGPVRLSSTSTEASPASHPTASTRR